MLPVLAIVVFIISKIHSYDLRYNYNIQLKDSVHYKVEQNVVDSDYEMIKRDELGDFTLNIKDKRELNKLASRQYDDMLKVNKDRFKGTNSITAIVKYRSSEQDTGSTTISNASTYKGTQHVTKRKETAKNQGDEVYDYNSLLNEYYEESMSDAVSNQTYHPRSESAETGLIYTLKRLVSLDTQTVNCKQFNKIGLKAVSCLWNDYKAQTESPRALAFRFWKIMKAWLFVYLAVAMPLWCTRGWCCCCLYCKFFRPHQTIDEAKDYLLSNPPGILLTRKGKKIEYEPTEREKERYEEFEHLLKTM